MTKELISKKELLDRTGISYGQFYRWKRKGLIPDNWITHQSTRTGQESFLPRDKILGRIEKIKELKGENTLKEIARLLSPELAEKKYERSSLTKFHWIDTQLLEGYEEAVGSRKLYSFHDLLSLTVFRKLKEAGLDPGEIYLSLTALQDSEKGSYPYDERIIVAKRRTRFFREGEEEKDHSAPGFCLLATGKIHFDRTVKIVKELELAELIQELKLKLRKGADIR